MSKSGWNKRNLPLWWFYVFHRLSTLPLQHEICISGNYSCLVAHFYLKRSVSYHLIQSYLPSILIVAISWVSFWMDIEAVPGRISLGVITLLAVSSQAGRPGQGELNWKYPLYKIQHMCYVRKLLYKTFHQNYTGFLKKKYCPNGKKLFHYHVKQAKTYLWNFLKEVTFM